MTSWHVACHSGYHQNSQNKTLCENINECDLSPCDTAVGICVDTPGSYFCSCKSGYRLNRNNRTCENINECAEGSFRCPDNTSCEDTQGNYICVCSTGYSAVRNFTISNISTNSLVLKWLPFRGNTIIYWIVVTGNPSKWINANSESVSVDGLTPGNEYTFSIVAIIEDMAFVGCYEISTYTRPEVIQNLNPANITTRSVFLDWLPPVGNKSFYEVQVVGNPSKSLRVSSESVSVDGLTPGNQYKFSIAAFAGDSETHGDWSEISTYTRPEVIQNLNPAIITTRSVFLDWLPPVGNKGFYEVQVVGTPSKSLRVSSESVSVDGLTPGNQYMFSIAAFAGDGETHGDWSEISTYTRPEVIQNLNPANITTRSIFLYWLAPVGNKGFYEVRVTGNPSKILRVSSESVSVDGLTPGNEYMVSIAAFAGDSETHGDWSEISTYTRPEVIQNLNTANITTRSVFLDWLPPVGNKNFYEVQVVGTPSKNLRVSSESVSVDGLTPGNQYMFSIAAFAGDRETHGDWSEISTYTRPEVIQNLNTANITTRSVFLDWLPPVGNKSFYEVQVVGSPSKSLRVSSESVSVDGLTPGNEYMFSIAAFAGDSETHGDWSEISTYTRPDNVRNLTVVNVTTTSILWNWLSPEGNGHFYHIVIMGNPSRNLTSRLESFFMSGLIPGNHYTLMVSSVAADNKTQGDWSNISTFTVPEVVQNPRVSDVSANALFLSWLPPVGNKSSYWIEVLGNPSQNLTVTSESLFLYHLLPGTWYTFRISALAGERQGDWKEISEHTSFTILTNLTVSNISTNSLILSWFHAEGSTSSYSIEVFGDPSKILNVTEESAFISGLVPGSRYKFRISVAGEYRRDDNQTTIFAFTRPEIVRDFRIRNKTTTSAFVDWIGPVGNKSFYEVRVTGNPSKLLQVSSESVSVDGLIPGNEYMFSIAAFAGDSETHGDWSEISTYTRPEMIQNLNTANITTRSVFLDWLPPVGNKSFYEVQVVGNPSKSLRVSSESVSVDGLTPGNQYMFSIAAFAGDGETHGDWSEISTYTRPEVIQNLNTANITTRSIFLYWLPPVGNKSFYEVRVTGNSSKVHQVSSESISVDGLTPGNQYMFSIAAFAGDSETHGDWSEISTYTRPEVIQNLNTVNITTRSIFLDWLPPVGNKSFYEVRVTGNSSKMLYVSSESVSVDGLTPGNQYMFSIAAFAGDSETHGAWSEISTYARPEMIQNLNTANITTRSVFLDWLPPVGNKSFYEVRVTGNPSKILRVSSEFVSVDGLTPGNEYMVSIAAFAGDSETHGDWSEISTYTRPEVIQNLNTANITTRSVFLDWLPPVGNKSFYEVQVVGSPSKSLRVSSESVSVDGLTPGNEYMFSIAAFAGDSETHGDWSEISTYTRPDNVRNLTVVNVTTTSILWNWLSPEGNRNFYHIVIWGNPSRNLTSRLESFFMPGLIPGNHYTLMVSSVAADNKTQGDWSNISTFTVPKVIQNLRVSDVSANALFLSWLPPVGNKSSYWIEVLGNPSQNLTVTSESLFLYHLLPGTWYTFRISALAGERQGDWKEISEHTSFTILTNLTVSNVSTNSLILSWFRAEGSTSSYSIEVFGDPSKILNVTEESALISGLVPGSRYKFRISVAGEYRRDENQTTIFAFTRPEIVRDFRIINKTTTSAFVDWIGPEGNKSFYEVRVTGNPSKLLQVSSESVSVDGLIPGNEYMFSIAAFAGDSETHGDWSEISTYTRPEVIQNLNTANITTRSVFLDWLPPVGNKSFYEVQVVGNPSKSLRVSSESVSVDGLTPGNQYMFSIAAFAGDSETHGDRSEMSTYTRPEVIQNLNPAIITTRSVFLDWLPPVGNKSFYEVQVVGTQSKSLRVSSESVSVDGLTPGNQYKFSIAAFAGDSETHGDWSEISTYTRPEVIQNLNTANITTRSVFLYWLPPVGNKSFYEVQVMGTPSKNLRVSSESVSVDGLTPGNQYKFSIAAFAGDGETHGDWSEISTYTRPEVIQNLNTANITTRSIFLDWLPPVGNKSFYEVRVTGTPSKSLRVSSESVSVDGLTPGNQYMFRIAVFAGDSATHGDWRVISTYTRPDIIRNLKFLNVTVNSVDLGWEKPEGNRSSYRIEIEGDSSWSRSVTSESAHVGDLEPGHLYRFLIYAISGNGLEGERVVNSAHTHTSAVYLSLKYSTFNNLTNGEEQKRFILQKVNMMLNQRFPDKNFTLMWKGVTEA
ncbi:receptor-type tyrosine-protein phosphatase beta [Microcaecilia unicolor]|uniref:Receptor-type tyrosine-protein phosphatase beta-like n=1 Tax=Microcaecilia unicolor TaxID=1415580 RepID=A0A6P7Z933_9AMPH|nr:receptor-type tyrosine-protein phosphatase beta-like [Microcaecilia unicolor]